MTDPTDKRIEELWQYIPPYTAPNHPPQVEVITTTNTGDTPMTDPTDIVTRLGDCTCVLHGEICREAADEIERLRKERDEARREAMLLLSDRASTKEMNAEYKKRGWEYLKDNP